MRIFSANLPTQVEEILLQNLREVFPDAEMSRVKQMAAEPPAWVRIIAEVLTWETVLKVAATAYLAQLGKHLADATWETRKVAQRAAAKAADAAIAPLRKVWTALRRAAADSGRALEVMVEVPWPSDNWGTGVSLGLADEDEFLEALARFARVVAGIGRATTALSEEGCRPLGRVRCFLLESGFRLQWMEQGNMRVYEQDFDEDGNSSGDRRRGTFY